MSGADERPVVSYGSLGGTITMTPQADGGIVPTLQASQLIASVPGLDQIVDVRAETLAQAPSASLTESQVLRAVAWARGEVDRGAAGVVLIQGTDSVEETSFLADCIWERDAPLVFTGAMRGPARASADGPANLLAAARVAASQKARGVGVMVVLDDTVHRAALVHKAHSTALSAFASYAGQVLGHVIEDEVWLAPVRPRPAALELPMDARFGFVPMWTTFLGDDGTGLRHLLNAAPDGVVVAGFGAGHVSSVMAQVISQAAAQCPVVLATRIGQGGAMRRTHGYPGSELDLQQRGAIVSGALDAPKSRVLLSLLLSAGADPDRISEEFELRGVRH